MIPKKNLLFELNINIIIDYITDCYFLHFFQHNFGESKIIC